MRSPRWPSTPSMVSIGWRDSSSAATTSPPTRSRRRSSQPGFTSGRSAILTGSTPGCIDSSCTPAIGRARRLRRRGIVEVHVNVFEAPASFGAPAAADAARDVVERDQLERGFQRLTPEQRAVLVVHHYLGLSEAEAARVLDIPVGTVKSRLSRATSALRAALDADERSAIANTESIASAASTISIAPSSAGWSRTLPPQPQPAGSSGWPRRPAGIDPGQAGRRHRDAWVGEDAPGNLGYRIRSRQVAVVVVALVLALLGAMLLVGAGLVVWCRPIGRWGGSPIRRMTGTCSAPTRTVRIPSGWRDAWLPGWSPRRSPDGRFSCTAPMQRTSSTWTAIPSCQTEGCCAAWSPNGTMIASAIGDDEGRSMTVVITGIDGAVRTRLELPGPINYLGSGTRS